MSAFASSGRFFYWWVGRVDRMRDLYQWAIAEGSLLEISVYAGELWRIHGDRNCGSHARQCFESMCSSDPGQVEELVNSGQSVIERFRQGGMCWQ